MEEEMFVLSLFDGISCGQQALKELGVDIAAYYASEVCKDAIKVTTENHTNTVHLGDVRGWRSWDIEWEKLNLILAGSPCQGFSRSGKQRGTDDTRSALIYEFYDILNHVKSLNPGVKFLLENVVMKKEYIDQISGELGLEPILYNARHVSAQNRERLYWFNWTGPVELEENSASWEDVREDQSVAIAAIRGRYIENEFGGKKTAQFIEFRKDNKTNTLTTVRKDNVAVFKRGEGKVLATDWDYRYLTPTECERLMNLPDGYTKGLSENKRVSVIGNAWSVGVVKQILKEVIKS